MEKARITFLLFCSALLIGGIAHAQTAATGTIVGTLLDSSGASVPNAQVDLSSAATSITLHTKSDSDGRYVFASVPPGTYSVTVQLAGFRSVVLSVVVEVSKSVQGNIILQVGEQSEKVIVAGTVGQELQTTNSTVGDVIGSREFENLPTTQRKVSELIYLQVATVPISGTGGLNGAFPVAGSVGGSRADQNSATLDGIVINDVALGGTQTGNVSTMPLPVDAVEEFRASVANADTTQARSSGGQFAMTTRRGTNQWHGAAYWYYQNGKLDANNWTNNATGQAKPDSKDNRPGVRIGGPIWKDKTFLSIFYEARRFPQSQPASEIGITDSLRQGILRFRDATGTVISYNLATSNLCGPNGNQACDPRGIGLSPAIAQYFSLYPGPNNFSLGDGLNTAGISAPVDTSLRDDVAIGRLDHNITEKWRFQGVYMWQQHRANNGQQVDFDPHVTNGALLKNLSGAPSDPRFLMAGITGVLTPRLLYEFKFGWTKQQIDSDSALPSVLAPLAGTALEVGGGLLGNPGDPGNGTPLKIQSNMRQYVNSLLWTPVAHLFTVGVSFQQLREVDSRFNRLGANEVPIAVVAADNFQVLTAADRPRPCGTGVVTNCLPASSVASWDQVYATVLGIWDSTSTFYRRDPEGNVLPFGALRNDDRWKHIEVTASDSWRLKPSLTLNYGVNITTETPLREANGLQYLVVDANTGQLIDPNSQLTQKLAAAAGGQSFNQRIAYVPRGNKNIYPAFTKVGPRAGLAWSPSFGSGLLRTIFGEHKTVLRGGYSLIYDSILVSNLEDTAIAGNQLLGTSAGVQGPACNLAGTPGAACAPGNANPAASAFRIGVDGIPPTPTAGNFTVPFVPTRIIGPAVGVDPNFTVGHVHGGNLTVQRQLPGNSLLEAGWIGRYGRNLPAAQGLGAPPTTIKDVTGRSDQTFAQAFDAVATQLRAGAPVTPQPWFEDLFGAGGTATLASNASSLFINGNLTPLFLGFINPQMRALGLPRITNPQYIFFNWHTNLGYSNYDAMFVTLHKSYSRGLSFTFNYTWSHCRDLGGTTEDSGGQHPTNPYNPNFDYGDCFFDLRHNIQTYGSYDIPLPKWNHLTRVTQGWSASYIFGWHSGFPLFITESGDIFGDAGFSNEVVRAIGPAASTGLNSGVAGSGGVGTAGNPSAGGTGLNLFANPQAVYDSLRAFLISQDTRSERGAFRGLGYWNLDTSIAKKTKITERVSARFSADFFNMLNHPNFNTPTLSLSDPADFGVITSAVSPQGADTNVGPRRIQFGLRIEF
jgi:hypothetical protein